MDWWAARPWMRLGIRCRKPRWLCAGLPRPILFGAVGDPKYDDPQAKVRPEQALLGLRKELGLFANLRPVWVHPALADASPLSPSWCRAWTSSSSAS